MLPQGTVTFLFTDIEGSTRLWEEQTAAMQLSLARYDKILQSVVKAHKGSIVKTTGDGMLAMFQSATDALHTAADAHRITFPKTRSCSTWGATSSAIYHGPNVSFS